MPRAMKDSDVDWLGEIPADWKTIKIKHTSWLKGRIGWQGLTASEYIDEGPFLVTGTDFQNGIVNWSSCAHISKERFDEDSDIHIKEGDLLITKDGTVGKVAIAKNCPDEVSLNSGVLLIRNTGAYKYYDKYLYYVLLSDTFWRWYTLSQTGQSTIKHLYQAQFYSFEYTYPPLDEQQRIATFLDGECARIDSVIEKTRASVEEYKKLKQALITRAVTKGIRPNRPMKQSGIEWLGDIPADWMTPKLSSICSVITDYVASGSFASLAENVEYLDEPDYAMLIRTADVSNKGYTPKPVYINQHAYKFLSNSNLFGGELMFPNIGASVGDVYIVPVLYERMSLAPNAIMVKTNQIDKYYYYYFQSKPGRLSIEDIAQSTAQAKFNKTDFRQLRVLLPPLEEQKEIAQYLDGKTAAIDSLIEKKGRLVTELERLKKSLIFEYVTGKKEAPEKA